MFTSIIVSDGLYDFPVRLVCLSWLLYSMFWPLSPVVFFRCLPYSITWEFSIDFLIQSTRVDCPHFPSKRESRRRLVGGGYNGYNIENITTKINNLKRKVYNNANSSSEKFQQIYWMIACFCSFFISRKNY